MLMPNIPMRQYALSSILVVSLGEAHDILCRMSYSPGLNSIRSLIGIFVISEMVVISGGLSCFLSFTSLSLRRFVNLSQLLVKKRMFRGARSSWRVHPLLNHWS